jgi:hypothetical protein
MMLAFVALWLTVWASKVWKDDDHMYFSSRLFSWASMLSQMYADSVVLIGAEIFGTTWDTDVPLKMGIVDHHMENEITRYLNDRYYCAP